VQCLKRHRPPPRPSALGIEGTIFLVVDGRRIHRAKKLPALLKQLDGKITLFFLPPHSPQLNPDEWVWNQVKQRIAKQPERSKQALKAHALSALR
jgi:transposase